MVDNTDFAAIIEKNKEGFYFAHGIDIIYMMNEKIETQNVEFKSSWRDENLKTVCAFANSEGGTLFIGLDDNNKPVEIKNFGNYWKIFPIK